MTTTPTFTVERSITVDAPPAAVYEQLADLRRWTAWSPWEGLDPQLQRTYSGTATGTGAVYEWSGNRKAGRGRMEITQATAPEAVVVDLAFEKPMRSRSVTRFTLRPQDRGTHVTWTMTGPRPLVMRLMSVVMSMDKLIGPDFEKGLTRLKAVSEAPPEG